MATDGEKRDEEKKKASTFRSLSAELGGLGFSVVFFVIIGVVLDSLLKTAPLFILLGVFFGLFSLVYFMYRLVKNS